MTNSLDTNLSVFTCYWSGTIAEAVTLAHKKYCLYVSAYLCIYRRKTSGKTEPISMKFCIWGFPGHKFCLKFKFEKFTERGDYLYGIIEIFCTDVDSRRLRIRIIYQLFAVILLKKISYVKTTFWVQKVKAIQPATSFILEVITHAIYKRYLLVFTYCK